MILTIEENDYICTNAVNGKLTIVICRTEDKAMVDSCAITVRLRDELEKRCYFDVVSLFGEAEKLIDKHGIIDLILSETIKRDDGDVEIPIEKESETEE